MKIDLELTGHPRSRKTVSFDTPPDEYGVLHSHPAIWSHDELTDDDSPVAIDSVKFIFRDKEGILPFRRGPVKLLPFMNFNYVLRLDIDEFIETIAEEWAEEEVMP